MTITEFLEARIAEDEHEATSMLDSFARGGEVSKRRWIRVLAECAAKRAIIDLAGTAGCLDSLQANLDYGYDSIEEEMLRTLATVYADHPDYRQEWTP